MTAWLIAMWALIVAFFGSLVASPRDYQRKKKDDDDDRHKHRTLRDLPPVCGPTS